MTLVKTEVKDRVAIVTVNDPPRRNALSLDMAETPLWQSKRARLFSLG